MSNIVLILVIVGLVKAIFFTGVILLVFRDDLKAWWAARKIPPTTPICLYCQSRYTYPTGESETRWETDELVLVTTYQCEHCNLPFWHVERVPVGVARQ